MKKINKVVFSLSISLLCSASALVASTYTVQNGDTITGITYKLGFNSIDQAKFTVPSGNLDKIFPGDILNYKKKKKIRFVKKEIINLKKFCFKDSRSIHYRAVERCR